MFKGNICCVDVSYLTFYRLFALRKWYGFAYKDDESVKDKDYKWLDNEIFMGKFKKTLLDTVLKICKKKSMVKNIICVKHMIYHKDIWRKNLKKIKVNCIKEQEVNHIKNKILMNLKYLILQKINI